MIKPELTSAASPRQSSTWLGCLPQPNNKVLKWGFRMSVGASLGSAAWAAYTLNKYGFFSIVNTAPFALMATGLAGAFVFAGSVGATVAAAEIEALAQEALEKRE